LLTITKKKWYEAGINGAIKPLEVKILSGGSTDVGDVSYIVPEITLMATTAPYESGTS
jgi:aminobenzoyl-glutamate utilization protein B